MNKKKKSIVHQRENNAESEAHLKENEDHFNRQCIEVLNLLKSGVVLTQKIGMNDYDIGDTGRRIRDLKKAGVEIQSEWIIGDGKKKCKKWFIKGCVRPVAEKKKPVSKRNAEPPQYNIFD